MADAMAAVAEPLDPLDGPRTMWPGTERMLPFSSAATVLCATVVLLRTRPSGTKEERANTVDAAVANFEASFELECYFGVMNDGSKVFCDHWFLASFCSQLRKEVRRH